MAAKGETVAAMIDYIVEKINYKDYLEKQHGPDHVNRVENINELKSACFYSHNKQALTLLAEITPIKSLDRMVQIVSQTSLRRYRWQEQSRTAMAVPQIRPLK